MHMWGVFYLLSTAEQMVSVVNVFALLGWYAAQIGSWLVTIVDNHRYQRKGTNSPSRIVSKHL
jgi:hypothetical protein